MRFRAFVMCLLAFLVESCTEAPTFVTVAPEPKNHAWYLRAEYHPREHEIRGVPIKSIREQWCKVSEFSQDLFPRELLYELQDSDKGSPFFSIDNAYSRSGSPLTTVVGAYESCDGRKGLFILVLNERSLPREIRFVGEFEGMKAIAHLKKVDDRSIGLWWCGSCDNVQYLEWDEKDKKFVWVFPEFSGDGDDEASASEPTTAAPVKKFRD